MHHPLIHVTLDTTHLLVGGATARHEHHVESGEAADGYDEEADDHDEEEGDEDRDVGELLPVEEHEGDAEAENEEHVGGEGGEEVEEVFVVAAADAVADPGAVVVHGVDAGVADAAVGAARRAVELAGGAPLHAHVYVVDEHGLVAACLVVA